MKTFFLGKHGRAYGPYSEKEIEGFQQSGEIRDFNWLWDTDKKIWDALDCPPPPVAYNPEKQEPHTFALRHDSLLPLEVIAHDGKQAITGGLRYVKDGSCELVSTTPVVTPPFRVPSEIMLSLLDSTSGQTVNVRSQVITASRSGRTWHYQLKWSGIPELVLKTLAP